MKNQTTKVMLIKYLILISFLNLVLGEAFAMVCFENNDKIKYENVFDSCCKKEHQQLSTLQNSADPAIHKSTGDCCVDYDHNYTFVTEQNVMDLNCKDYSPAEIHSKEIDTKYSSYDYPKHTPLNIYNRQLIKTTVIRA